MKPLNPKEIKCEVQVGWPINRDTYHFSVKIQPEGKPSFGVTFEIPTDGVLDSDGSWYELGLLQ